MKYHAFPNQELIIVDVEERLDLAGSMRMVKKITSEPTYDEMYEILMDLRGTRCLLSITDIYTLASHLAQPNPALPTRRKIAILVDPGISFDHAEFLAVCGQNRGLWIRSFSDLESAEEWLSAEIPHAAIEES